MKRTAWLAAALYTAVFWAGILIPFDFHWPGPLLKALRDSIHAPEWSFFELAGHPLHFAFFLPFGVLLERQLAAGSRRRAFAVLLVAALFAFGSEFAQLFVGRGASPSDLAMDGAGCACGLLAARRFARSHRLQARARRCLSPPLHLAGIAVSSALLAGLLIPLDTSFADWDREAQLLLANEATGGRPWAGEIQEVALLGRALGPEDARRLSGAGATVPLPAGLEPIVHYPLSPPSLFLRGAELALIADRSGLVPPADLHVEGTGGVTAVAGGGIAVTGKPLITSYNVPARVAEAIERSRAFTLIVRFQARDPAASGPARIVSFSRDTALRNFTLGQDKSALVLRVRNRVAGANGDRPDLVARDCVRAGERQAAVAISAGGQSLLYVDGELRAAVHYTGLRLLERLTFRKPPGAAAGAGLVFIAWAALAVSWYFALALPGRLRGAARELAAALLAAGNLATLAAAGRLLHAVALPLTW